MSLYLDLQHTVEPRDWPFVIELQSAGSAGSQWTLRCHGRSPCTAVTLTYFGHAVDCLEQFTHVYSTARHLWGPFSNLGPFFLPGMLVRWHTRNIRLERLEMKFGAAQLSSAAYCSFGLPASGKQSTTNDTNFSRAGERRNGALWHQSKSHIQSYNFI